MPIVSDDLEDVSNEDQIQLIKSYSITLKRVSCFDNSIAFFLIKMQIFFIVYISNLKKLRYST